ncbi:MAG TPA: hypothetical protein VG870_09580 [Chitinophagaceae bacterium]|nr:hypothetical protein [Chitinophagaceae bacterium]
MKTPRWTVLLLTVMLLVTLVACNRAFTPYDAATHPPRRCRALN